MRRNILLLLALVFGVANLAVANGPDKNEKQQKTFHDFVVKDINGQDFKLSQLKGKKVLVVNTASECGLTPQLEKLQSIYEQMDQSKFEIIAFPANNFLKQDPGTNEEILEFCQKNYGVTFQVMSKVSVCDFIYTSYPPEESKSEATSTDEIYLWLTQKSLNGVADTKMQWNFQKFLIDESGNLIGTIQPAVIDEISVLMNWMK